MKVLFCGGPVDGQWREIDRAAYESRRALYRIEVVAPPTPLEFAHGTGTMTKVRYRVWPVTLLGYHTYVATPEDFQGEDDAVLYAVLRRDVADHLRGLR